jgi:DNA-binding transcriptional LysR family regulator
MASNPTSDIENRLLRYFVAVAEEQHFARAAERPGVTPPTLTHQIQKLERDLGGVKLLRRKGNRKTIVTAAGQRLLVDAREILHDVEEAFANVRKADRGELGRLKLGFLASMSAAGMLRGWIAAFRRAHPAIEVAIHKRASLVQITGILRKELDAGFARMPNKYPSGVRGFEIFREPLALALPREHPLARHKAIKPAMLASEAFVSITPELDMGFFGFTEAIGHSGNFIPRVVQRDEDFTTVLAYVALGYGIAVVPGLMKTTTVSNVVFRDIAADPVPQTSIAFIYGSDPSPSTKLLIGHMQRHALRNRGSRPATPPAESERLKGVASLSRVAR